MTFLLNVNIHKVTIFRVRAWSRYARLVLVDISVVVAFRVTVKLFSEALRLTLL